MAKYDFSKAWESTHAAYEMPDYVEEEPQEPKQIPIPPKQSLYKRLDSRIGGILPAGAEGPSFKDVSSDAIYLPRNIMEKATNAASLGLYDKFMNWSDRKISDLNDSPIESSLYEAKSPLGKSAGVVGEMYGMMAPIGVAYKGANLLARGINPTTTAGKLGKTALTGGLAGAGYEGALSALEGNDPSKIAEDAGRGALFFGAGGLAGDVIGAGVNRYLPNTPNLAKDFIHGATVGGTGLTATIPTLSDGEKPTLGDLGTTAGSLGAFSAIMSALSRGKIKPDMPTKEVISPEVKADIPTDINGARNILNSATNFGRATRILDAYPELGAEFPQFRLKQGDKVILPNGKEATVKNADRLIIQAEVDGKTVSVGRKVVKIPETKVEVPEQVLPEVETPETIQQPAVRETRSGAEILPDENIMQADSQAKSMAEDIGLKPEKAETETKVDTTTQETVDGPERAGYYDPGTIGAARLTPPETIDTITSKTNKPVLTERLAPSNVGNMIKKAYYRTVDGYNRLNDFDKAANRAGRTIPFNKRAYILAHNTTNAEAMARRTLEENMVNAKGEPVYAPLKDIVKQVPKGEWRKFEDYLKLKHYKAWENSDMTVYDREINMSPEMADLKISKYDNKYSWMNQAAKDYTAWINKFGEEWLVKTGLLSENVWNAMRLKYGDYIPLQRMMEEVEIGKTGVNGSFADQPNPVKRARGSERKTIESLETMLERVPNYIKAAKRNEVMQKVIEGIRQDPEGMSIWGEIVDSNTANLTMPNIVAGRINGERVHVRVNDLPLLEAISGLTPQAQNVIINAARSLTSKMKLLTTGINPIFSLGRNVVRDLPMSYVASKSTNNPIEWSRDIVGALVDILGNRAAYRSYKDMGGGYASAVSTDVNILADSKAKLMPGYYDLSNIKNPVEYTRRLMGIPFKALEKIADVTEAVPRLGEYRRIVRKEGNSYASRTKALYESKDVTVNFQKKNTADVTNFLDTFIPYFGASVNGLDKLGRIYRDNPVAAINKTIGAITIPTLMLYAMNYDNEEYRKLSSWVKDTNHLIPLPNGTFLKMPKPREGGVVFGALVERTLDSLLKENPDAFYKFMDTVKASFFPPIRTIYAPVSDIRANKDFVNRPIVPKYMESMSAGQQYDEKTSSFAKMLGEVDPSKISPKQVDYLVKSYLGVIGQIGIPALSEGSTGDAIKRIFTADPAYSNDTIQKFYDKKKEYDTIKADTKQTGDTVDANDEKLRKLYSKVAEMISDNANEARELQKNKDILQKQKANKLRDIQLKTIILADIVNRPVEEQLKIYNDLKRKKFIVETKPKSESKTKAEQKRQQKRNDAIGKIISQ